MTRPLEVLTLVGASSGYIGRVFGRFMRLLTGN
jgi:hypothetical protein